MKQHTEGQLTDWFIYDGSDKNLYNNIYSANKTQINWRTSILEFNNVKMVVNQNKNVFFGDLFALNPACTSYH